MKYLIEVLDSYENYKKLKSKPLDHATPADAKLVFHATDEDSVTLCVIQCPVLEEIPKDSVIKITRI